jgi:copper homeostasis protein
MSPQVQLEVAVESVESARAAEKGGATRVEVCSALNAGGITPCAGLIAMVRRNISIAMHVLIRPRAGGFCYSQDELEVIHRDIVLARQLGADGIALGLLDADGKVDVIRTRALVELAAPMQVTFHRAFDFGRKHPETLSAVLQTGAARILTSGGAPTAEQGIEVLHDLVLQAGSRITITAAGKIRESNVASLIRATGVREIHANLALPTSSPVREHNQLSLGTAPGFNDAQTVVTADAVAALLRAASGPF